MGSEPLRLSRKSESTLIRPPPHVSSGARPLQPVVRLARSTISLSLSAASARSGQRTLGGAQPMARSTLRSAVKSPTLAVLIGRSEPIASRTPMTSEQ